MVRRGKIAVLAAPLLVGSSAWIALSQQPRETQPRETRPRAGDKRGESRNDLQPPAKAGRNANEKAPFEAVEAAQLPREVPAERPEQKKNKHDLSDIFKEDSALSSTPVRDCHVNGHTTGQFHLNPDGRPLHRRFRLDTVSLRGIANAPFFVCCKPAAGQACALGRRLFVVGLDGLCNEKGARPFGVMNSLHLMASSPLKKGTGPL